MTNYRQWKTVRLNACKTAAWAMIGALVYFGGHTAAEQQRPTSPARVAPAAPKTPVIVVSGPAQRVLSMSGQRSSPPAVLSPTEKAGIFSAALGLSNVTAAGIGGGIRLTPSQPFLPGRGRLEFAGVKAVLTDQGGGRTEMLTSYQAPKAPDGTRQLPAVVCSFRPTVVNQALLVDMSVWINGAMSGGTKGRVRMAIPGTSFEQVIELPEGANHVTAIYKPTDLAEKSIVLSDTTYTYSKSFTFFACEITPLLKP